MKTVLNHLFIAQGFEFPKPAANSTQPSLWMSFGDTLPVLVAGLGVALIVAICVLIVWKKRKSSHRHHHHHHHSRTSSSSGGSSSSSASESSGEDEDDSEPGQRQRRRRRIRRRDHRPRNPTLAETGGLPPIKQPDSRSTPPL